MQLISFTDYSLRALIYMATLREVKMTNITEVIETYGVSRNHMVKIINQLSRAEFIAATRGKNSRHPSRDRSASYRYRRRGTKNGAATQLVDCAITLACCLRKALNDAVQLFLRELDSYTLADLVKGTNPYTIFYCLNRRWQ